MLLHKSHPPVIVLAVLLIACSVAALGAQAGAASVGFKSLTLTLSVPVRAFLLLEPLPLTITLENRTTEPVVGHSALRFADRTVGVLIQPDGSPAYSVERLSALAAHAQITPLTLPPGYRQVSTEPLMVDLRKILPTPGKYTIQAALLDRNGDEIRSNVVGIEVAQPVGLDQLAYQFLIDGGKTDYFFVGADAAGNPDVYGEYETFARIYRGTVYADYANLSLGRIQEARGDLAAARQFFTNVTSRNEYAAQQAAEALKRLPAQ